MDFSSDDVALWKAELEGYEKRLLDCKPEAVDLELILQSNLLPNLRLREPEPYLTKDELLQIMKYLVARGRFVDKTEKLQSHLKEERVKSASKKALAELPDLKKAITNLRDLDGISIVAASGILSFCKPAVLPYMSTEACKAAMGGERYTDMENYKIFAAKLQEKAEAYTRTTTNGHNEDEDEDDACYKLRYLLPFNIECSSNSTVCHLSSARQSLHRIGGP